ncbi:MBL fold metallo-hydrolase [Fictibacillus terranigra]|uniref:MBL fold metallo-hydrolase n=1 Tax=Fictibacillus terranigra TaxID=3058424 RepID=A0ABT8EBK7_9BACL|nr:MBL fold metallo-hydrolase [Fictibacillus sp. CENA-BCM004]MDN4075315.1 MBL fold metallo-hydrolase [Fictibacillus sp. CENA-BCM004]
MIRISANLFLFEDTCHVYVIKNGNTAVLIDFGAGDVLQSLPLIGVEKVTDILMTHHHRDQAQGLHDAVKAGIRIWVPHNEQDLFQNMNEHWGAREIDNNYNMRQDRFSLLHSVPISGTLKDYSTHIADGLELHIVPTPGHTVGSITIMAAIDGKMAAFTGDLIYAPGKIWSLSATQWTYNGGEGIARSVLSLLDLKEKNPDVLLPSHGQIMDHPIEAIDLLVERLAVLMKHRKQNPRLFELRERPYEAITPHLLKNRTSMANGYVLLSESGNALLIDYGYDFLGGFTTGSDRASRRPWLYTLSKLKEQYGVKKIDVVLPTHFHDDHVAGINLLREVEGTELWCPQNFSDVLENPKKYDLPCLWYDPIKVDRQLPMGQKVKWEEYEITVYEQGGHTLYAAALQFEVDGARVLAIGDQHQGEDEYNYVYGNKFRIGDYIASAELYKTLQPDFLLSGHWDPIFVTPEYLERIEEKGKVLEQLHKDLLPLENVDFGADGFGAVIQPYQTKVKAGESYSVHVQIKNPFNWPKAVLARIIVPEGWKVDNAFYEVALDPKESGQFTALISVPQNVKVYRERIAVDLTVGEIHFGQHAEALVSVHA